MKGLRPSRRGRNMENVKKYRTSKYEQIHLFIKILMMPARDPKQTRTIRGKHINRTMNIYIYIYEIYIYYFIYIYRERERERGRERYTCIYIYI